ncbi:MAG: glycosyltransferase family 2 protein [Pseudomonadota bacterium]
MDTPTAQTSFVIPCYNHEQYLEKSLGGVLNQSLNSAKIIFINDASTDNSLYIANQLLSQRPDTKIVSHTKNQGVIASLNEGLSYVDTPYVAFAATDDYLYPQFLEKSERALQDMPTAALVTSCSHIMAVNDDIISSRPAFLPAFRSGYLAPQKVKKLLVECDNFLLGNVTLYRTQHLRDIGGFDKALGSFCDGFAMRLLALRYGFVFLKAVLGCWRSHTSNYSKSLMYQPRYAENMVEHVSSSIAHHKVERYFPKNYNLLLLSRLKFGAARMLLEDCGYTLKTENRSSNTELLKMFGSLRSLTWLSTLPSRKLRTFLAYALLYLKYKPYQYKALLRLLRNGFSHFSE